MAPWTGLAAESWKGVLFSSKIDTKTCFEGASCTHSSPLTQTKAQYPKFPLWEAGTERTASPPATAGGTNPRFEAFHPILVPLSPSNDVGPGRAEVRDHAEALGCQCSEKWFIFGVFLLILNYFTSFSIQKD